MEKSFLQDRLVRNPFQDPMGNDAHQGLERWLDKFHQPSVPSHTIITDPEFFVFLWFHDAMGNLIYCPYAIPDKETDNYIPETSYILDQNGNVIGSGMYGFKKANQPFVDGVGIQGGTDNPKLPDKCLDLTPFVTEATLPPIKPANGDKIQTLFGETSAGSFSPYASDGQQSITLTMIDTEYSILDAIFYPWMKDINSPWWYRPDKAFTEWATPYPMATLEVQRPRMRYRNYAKKMDSRNDADYIYYSYKFIGIKPTEYSSFMVNAGGATNLTRTLTLVADMCLVDLTSDAAGSTAFSDNIGNRRSFVFSPMPPSTQNAQEEQVEQQQNIQAQQEKEREEVKEELQNTYEEEGRLEEEIAQQQQGDMPGEDEDEWKDRMDPDYNPDEFIDPYGDGSIADEQVEMPGNDPEDDFDHIPHDGEDEEPMPPEDENPPPGPYDEEPWERDMYNEYDYPPDDEEEEGGDSGEYDEEEPDWDAEPLDEMDEVDPNGDLDNYELDLMADRMDDEVDEEDGAEDDPYEKDSSFFQDVADAAMEIGSDVMDAAGEAAGWVADAADEALGLAMDAAEGAVGVAVDVADSAIGLATDVAGQALDVASDVAGSALDAASDVAGSALDVASNVTQQAVGVAGDLAATTLGAASEVASKVGDVASSTIGTATDLAGKGIDAAGTAASTALGAVGSAASSVLGGIGGLFGGSSSSSSETASSPSSSSPSDSGDGGDGGGGLFSALGSALSGAAGLGNTAFGVVSKTTSTASGAIGGVASSALGAASSIASTATGAIGGAASTAIGGASGLLSSAIGSATSSTTSLLGGVMGKGLSSAFNMASGMVSQSGNVLGGVLSNVSKVATSTTKQASGMVKQVLSATNGIRQMGVLSTTLNSAQKTISSSIGLVGNVADGVMKVGSGTAQSALGTFGKLVGRMTRSEGNKPTPVESYVAMVAKKNTKSATMA